MIQFFTAFCTGCILIGSLYIICPEGNISKSVKYVFSLAFLLIIVSAANIPFNEINIDFITQNTDSLNYNEMQIAAAEYVYAYTLNKANINFRKIYICTDNSTSDSIEISKVVIVSDEEHSKILDALGELAKNRKVEITNE